MAIGPNVDHSLVDRAVAAVCAQTFDAWQLVVIGDGCSPPATPRGDPRIVRHLLPENHGRYYADAVVLAATRSEYFTVHDADDAADPRWLASMVEAIGDRPAVLTSQNVIRLNGAVLPEAVGGFRGHTTLHHHAHMAGLWRRSWLDAVGAPHPAFRVGFDTLLTSLPWLTHPEGPAIINDPVLYFRHKRPGSLTTSQATGMRSRARLLAREQLIALYASILDALREPDVTPPEDLIGQVLSGYPTHEQYGELMTGIEQHAKRLADIL